METIFIKVKNYWVSLEKSEPQSNPVLELGLGIMLFACLVVGILTACQDTRQHETEYMTAYEQEVVSRELKSIGVPHAKLERTDDGFIATDSKGRKFKVAVR